MDECTSRSDRTAQQLVKGESGLEAILYSTLIEAVNVFLDKLPFITPQVSQAFLGRARHIQKLYWRPVGSGSAARTDYELGVVFTDLPTLELIIATFELKTSQSKDFNTTSLMEQHSDDERGYCLPERDDPPHSKICRQVSCSV